MLAPYPVARDDWAFPADEAVMESAMACVRGARSLRAAYGLQPRARPAVYVLARTDAAATAAAAAAPEMRALAGADSLAVLRDAADAPPGCGVEVVSDAVSVYLNLKGAVDARAEADKLHKKTALLAKSLDSLVKQAAAADYVAKVPAAVRADNADKVARLRAEIAEAERCALDFEALLVE